MIKILFWRSFQRIFLLPALLLFGLSLSSFPAAACESYEDGVRGLATAAAKTGKKYATLILTEEQTERWYEVLVSAGQAREGGNQYDQFAFGIAETNKNVVTVFAYMQGCFEAYFQVPIALFVQLTSEYGSDFPLFKPVKPSGEKI